MGCNISTCCGIGSSLIGGCKCSVQYGYTDKVITFTAAGTFNIWLAEIGILALSGTVVVQPQAPLANPVQIIVNGGDISVITDFDIFSASINPLRSVEIVAPAGTTELCVSIIANGFECC
ncbi:hypothetical protein SH1V18_32900 [Vallitalea longa]|uniref:Uncharacterized protein n=1 Tax=Vallitalea longa TaxID=2936439 RepID=A0A9W6DFP7_9FIRM|nr:hypothetical protein [Vallitalea longa]GKX30810.1 hypothetical protein SH1V18_32900 [Vallitalea longa]